MTTVTLSLRVLYWSRSNLTVATTTSSEWPKRSQKGAMSPGCWTSSMRNALDVRLTKSPRSCLSCCQSFFSIV